MSIPFLDGVKTRLMVICEIEPFNRRLLYDFGWDGSRLEAAVRFWVR